MSGIPTASIPASPPAPRGFLSRLELLVLALFFASGASALVYEVVWTRDLTNVFGGSAYAVATVLAAFMAGLALGSTLLGRLIDRRGHPLRIYGLLEAGIGLWALVLPLLLALLDRFYGTLYRSLDPGFYALSFVRFLLSFLVLIVPTTLMGGTLPVLGRFLLRNRGNLGRRAGILYAANTLGAVLGTAAGGFLLLPLLGLRGSTLIAVGINLAVAGAAMLAARRFPAREEAAEAPAPAEAKGAPETAGAWSRSPHLDRAVLWVYAASGFAALAYEVAWTKTLSMILGNTTYAFTAMLTTFLLGLSLGSLIFGRLADRAGRPEALLGLVQAGIPLTALATIPILQALPQLFVNGFYVLDGKGWGVLELYRVALAGMTMILPTILMGGTFPLVTRLYVGREDIGTRLGRLYAANTVGAILGSFLAGFVLIPWIGRQHSILAACFVNLAAALGLLAAVRWSGVPAAIRWALGAVLILTVPAWILGLRPWEPRIMASGAYVYAPFIPKDSSILESMSENNLVYYDEATEATVSVWNTEFTLSLRTNGKIEASSHGDMITQKLISHLPVLYHRGEPESALMIGLASGISVGSLLSHPLDRVETVELIPSMARAARFFDDYNRRCLDDPRHRLIMNDGRNHLLLTDKTYDIIVSEPSNPWIAGVGSLFTREFFELTKARLAPGGVVCQWVQTYQLQESDLRTILATFLDAYPHLHLWQGALGDLILVGSLEPLALDLDKVRSALEGPSGEDFAGLGILPLSQTLSLFVTDRDGIVAFVGDRAGRVTDDNLYLEYAVPRHMFLREGNINVRIMDPVVTSPVPYLTGSGIDSALIADIGRYRLARGLAQRVRSGSLPDGASTKEEALLRALEIAPGEQLGLSLYAHEINERAIQHLLAGRTAEAAPLFRIAANRGPSSERALALNNLGAIAFEAGEFDSAGVFWDRALADEPNYPTVLTNLASLAAHHGDPDRAVEYLRKARVLNPDHPTTLNNLAFELAVLGTDLEEADRLARRAVTLDPDPNNRDTLGFVLLRRGKWRESAEILSGVVQDNPTAYESYLHLGMAEVGRGRTDAARAAFTRVIEHAGDPSLVRRAQDELRKL